MESESERGTNLLNMGEELRCVGVVASLHRLVDALHHWLPPGCGDITFFWEHLFFGWQPKIWHPVWFSRYPGNLWQPLTRSKKIQKVSLNKKYFKTLLLFTSLRVPQTTTTPRPQGLFVDQWMTNGRVNRTRKKETNKLRNKTNI